MGYSHKILDIIFLGTELCSNYTLEDISISPH
jgi:hypothetical protein